MRSSPPPCRIAGYRLGPAMKTTLHSFIYLGTRMKPPSSEKFILKCIPTDSPHIFMDNVERECEIQKRLSHPYIMPILDIADDKNFRIISMQWARNGSLNDLFIKNHRNRELDNLQCIAKIMFRLLMAIEYLHGNRILHGDIKPANIVLAVNNDIEAEWGQTDPIPYLIDFGFARFLCDNEMCTCTDLSPPYASPEQLLLRPHAFPSDIYSLGLTFRFLILGENPQETADFAIMAKRLHMLSLDNIQKDSLRELISAMLNTKPERRPTAAQCLQSPFFEEVLGHDWIQHELITATPAIPAIDSKFDEDLSLDLDQNFQGF